MIIVKIQGGLANQMFQYAFGKSLSLKYKIPLYLDLSFYDYQSFRTFELDKFPNISSQEKRFEEGQYYIRDQNSFKKNKLVKGNSYFFDGYWQSEQYFKPYKTEILKSFAPPAEIKDTIEKKYGHLLNHLTVSMHIRRTDYLNSPNGFHVVQPASYYEKAIRLITGMYKKAKYKTLVFSDDLDWCKKNLQLPDLHFVENNTALTDLYLMSFCNHNIIANSSFSWWAAWLNINRTSVMSKIMKRKTVIAPAQWFGKDSGISNEEFSAFTLPKNWIKI
jgi:hypothetical protein